jgi:hypothetical protein
MQFTVPYLQFCTFTFAHAFLGISGAQTVAGLVLVLVLAVATAGSVPLSTLVVGAEASYYTHPLREGVVCQAKQRSWVGGGGRGKTETGFVLSRVGNLNTVLNIHASMYSRE